MKYVKQLAVILLFSAVGELLEYLIPLPIPASIYGMVLLFLALATKLLPFEAVKGAGSFLVSVLPLMFVVPIVGLMDNFDLIGENLIAIVVIIAVPTVLTFAVSGLVTQLILKKGGRKDA